MAEASDACKTVAESASQLVSGEAIHAAFSRDAGGSYSFFFSSDKSVVRDLCLTAVTLYGIYTASNLMARVIDGIVNRGLGGPRDDQATGEIKKGSLHVKLHCFTDERFLEVWTDYESGKMKTRLEEEFARSEIEIEGLKIEIENLEEVNDTKRAIESRLSTMADRYEQGYDEKRFEGPVRQDLFCSICQCVLRDPRTCQNREHAFCLSCISQHLRNSHTCPECSENLTPETLKIPRFLNNVLSELKIRCEFIERGCPGYVLLVNLQNHTERCGFAPVMCGNEECGMVVNKKDKEIHERELCQFRIAKCHDCKDIKASLMKENFDEMKASQDGIKENVDEMKASQNEMQVMITEMERNQSQIKEHVDEMKVELNATKVQNARMERKQDEINVKVNQIKENVDNIKQTQTEIKADQVMFKAEVREQFERVTEMLNQLLQGRNVNNNGAQAMEPLVSVNDQDIIIIGGRYGLTLQEVTNTVEKFNIEEGKSTELPRMNQPRVVSASCIYKNTIMVTGGFSGQDALDSIEVLNMNQHPLRWMMFQGKLPFKLYDHVAIVYQDKLYVIGGRNWSENKTSDLIHELALAAPYRAKVLTRMPQPRQNHRAEIVNGKLFIFGGRTTGFYIDATDSVLVYDFTTEKFKSCPSLPKPVWGMSTVTWGNKIIVIGGVDKNDQVLNDVIMYDTETGRSERLPSLNHKRYGHSAVIMHDVIVVLGGYTTEQRHLNSVESFTLGADGWKKLPGMKEKRLFPTAVVKPRN